MIRARISENSEAITNSDATKVESFQQETHWDVSLEHDIISISRTSKSETIGLDTHRLEQACWTLKTSILTCEPLSLFQPECSPEEFITLSRGLIGANWKIRSDDVFLNALSAEFEAIFESKSDEVSGIAEEEEKPISITYDGTTGVLTVKGNDVEFWELPVPDVIVTSSQFGEILAKHQGPGRDRHVLEILFDLKIAQIRDLVEEVRLLYSVPLTQAPEFACGTVMMNRNQPSLLGLLLRPRWRIK